MAGAPIFCSIFKLDAIYPSHVLKGRESTPFIPYSNENEAVRRREFLVNPAFIGSKK